LNIREQQKRQYQHDLNNHLDILSLPRIDRLKHYGLHFAKYAGRFARGNSETKSVEETVIDAFLVSLSAANVLNQALPEISELGSECTDLHFTDFAGRFADACEKIDHLEEFRQLAIDSNLMIMSWIVGRSIHLDLDLLGLTERRREQLASRLVFHAGS
jgi:hypothetical protein